MPARAGHSVHAKGREKLNGHLAMLLFAVLIIFGVVLYWQRKLGGVTGDCLGASIEVIETSLLLVLVCAKAVAG